MRRRVVVASALLAVASCGGSAPEPVAPVRSRVPQAAEQRSPTATNELLELVPLGADLLIELDLRRLRANPVIGRLFELGVEQRPLPSGFSALGDAHQIAIASYSVGAPEARTLTLVRGDDLPQPGPLGYKIDDHTVAYGPPSMIGELSTPSRPATSVTSDTELVALRDAAMPERASSAVVRVTARLDFAARLELARRLDLDSAPIGLSLWGDVIDDLAVVALLSGDDANDIEDLVRELERARDRLAAAPMVRELFLGHLLDGLKIERQGNLVRVVMIIEPRRLELVASRLTRVLEKRGSAAGSGAHDDEGESEDEQQ